MKRVAIFVLLCASAWGQANGFRPNLVQSYNFQNSNTLAFNNNVTSGNMLAVCTVWNDPGFNVASFSDTLGTSYGHQFFTDGLHVNIRVDYGLAPSSGADTITISGLSGAFGGWWQSVAEFSNVSATLDTASSTSTAVTAGSLTVTPTTTVNGDLLLNCIGASGNGAQWAFSFPHQFITGAVGGPENTWGFRNLGLAGAQTETAAFNSFFSSPPQFWGMMVTTFKPTAIAVATSALEQCAQGSTCKFTLTAVGGAGAYTYAATGLPSGASLNTSTGVITWTPVANGCTTAGFTVTDGSLTSSSRSLNFCAGSSYATPAFVQFANGNAANTSGTLTSVVAGQVIKVLGWGPESAGQINWVGADHGNNEFISDNLGTVFHRADPIASVPSSANGSPLSVWIGCATSSGNETAVYNTTTNTGFSMESEAYSGVQSIVDDGTDIVNVGAAAFPYNSTTPNYAAQVANMLLLADATKARNTPDTLTINAPFTQVFSGAIGCSGSCLSNLIAADGYKQAGAAGNYTVTSTANSLTSPPSTDTTSLQLIGLRPAIAGLGCNGTPVASSSVPLRVREY